MMRKLNVLSLMLLTLFCSCQNRDNSASQVTETATEPSYLENLPLDTDYEEHEEQTNVFTCVSEDGVMTFNSWNTGMGGTCPVYAVTCEFQTKDGKRVTEKLWNEKVDAAWVSAVHAIKKDDGTTYYIATRSHPASSNDGYMWMDAFMIDHDTLKEVSVYDAGDDLDNSAMEVNYLISDWYYTTYGDGLDWMFEYDAENKNLYIPQTVDIGECIPVISDRYRVYHFDGKKFVDKGESAHKGLHKSLANYYRLACYFRTKNYFVRIDYLDRKGRLRYASWKSAHDMSKQPDLVLEGGVYDEKKDTYTFTNDGYEYVVGHSEIIPTSDGRSEHREFLLVRKNGKILLKEERISPFDE